MKRWLPYPFTSVLLAIVWLLISQSLAVAHILLALLLALGLPLLTRSLRPLPDPYFYRPFALLRLLGMGLVEIIRSCFNVAGIILFVNKNQVRSQFIRVPLELSNPYGLAVLSCLININPGTVWVETLEEPHELVLHVFDLHDEQWWIDTIKTVYEKPLMEIFEKKVSV